MVIKTELCAYSEYRIYPGRGIRFCQRDGKVQLFLNHKMISLHRQRIKAVKLTWTQNWRRKNKKGKAEEAGKKRTKKSTKVQKAIVGMSLDDIKQKKAKAPELRAAAKDAVLKEHKEKAKKQADKTKTAAPGGKAKAVKAAPKVKGAAMHKSAGKR